MGQNSRKLYKTKRRTRDADQILHDDLATKARVHALKNQTFDEYLPGMGQHYCIPCARYCESSGALEAHQRSKVHKRSIKNLKFGPYTSQEAEAAGGRDVEKYLQKQEQQLRIHSQDFVRDELKPKESTSKSKLQTNGSVESMDVEQHNEVGRAETSNAETQLHQGEDDVIVV